MSLVELGDDLVAGLESVDFGSNGFDDSSTVGSGNDTVSLREGILSLCIRRTRVEKISGHFARHRLSRLTLAMVKSRKFNDAP